MKRKLRTVHDALGVPITPKSERASYRLNVLKYLPSVGELFSVAAIEVPGCSRRQISDAIKTLVRKGVLKYRSMGIIERVLDTEDDA